LKEIALYLTDRHIETSYDLLQRQQNFCTEKIRYYRALEEKINRKLTLLSSLKHAVSVLMAPELIHLDERFCLYSDLDVHDEISLAYACMKLENQIKQQDELVPVYASDCYAGEFSLNENDLEQTRLLFLTQPEKCSGTKQTAMLPVPSPQSRSRTDNPDLSHLPKNTPQTPHSPHIHTGCSAGRIP